MKPEVVEGAVKVAIAEIEYRLEHEVVDSEHELRTLTIILDFGKKGSPSVLSRVEMKRHGL